MKKFTIPVSWEVYGYLEIEASSLEEAISIAKNSPLPSDGECIEGSFSIDISEDS